MTGDLSGSRIEIIKDLDPEKKDVFPLIAGTVSWRQFRDAFRFLLNLNLHRSPFTINKSKDPTFSTFLTIL